MADEASTTTEATTANAESAAADAAADASTEAATTEAADGAASGTETAATAGDAKITSKQAAQAIKDAPSTEAGAEQVADALAAAPAEDIPALEALAKKLGFVVNGTEVTNRERAAFREHQKKWAASLQSDRQKMLEAIAAERAKHGGDIERAQSILQSWDSNDIEGFAKALGQENWEGLQKTIMARMADPHFERLQKIERELKETKEREAQAVEQARRQREVQEKQARRINYLQRLSSQMAGSNDDLIKEFHGDARFLEQIEQLQLQHWDDTRRTTVSPEQAISLGGDSSLRAQLKAQYERLHRVFGKGAESNGATSNGTAPAATVASSAADKKKSPGKTQVVKGSPVEAAGAAEWTDEKEFMKRFVEDMKKAAERDREEGKGLGN